MVVDAFPLLEEGIEGLGIEVELIDSVELVQVRAMGALNAAVEFGGAGRQDEQV